MFCLLGGRKVKHQIPSVGKSLSTLGEMFWCLVNVSMWKYTQLTTSQQYVPGWDQIEKESCKIGAGRWGGERSLMMFKCPLYCNSSLHDRVLQHFFPALYSKATGESCLHFLSLISLLQLVPPSIPPLKLLVKVTDDLLISKSKGQFSVFILQHLTLLITHRWPWQF